MKRTILVLGITLAIAGLLTLGLMTVTTSSASAQILGQSQADRERVERMRTRGQVQIEKICDSVRADLEAAIQAKDIKRADSAISKYWALLNDPRAFRDDEAGQMRLADGSLVAGWGIPVTCNVPGKSEHCRGCVDVEIERYRRIIVATKAAAAPSIQQQQQAAREQAGADALAKQTAADLRVAEDNALRSRYGPTLRLRALEFDRIVGAVVDRLLASKITLAPIGSRHTNRSEQHGPYNPNLTVAIPIDVAVPPFIAKNKSVERIFWKESVIESVPLRTKVPTPPWLRLPRGHVSLGEIIVKAAVSRLSVTVEPAGLDWKSHMTIEMDAAPYRDVRADTTRRVQERTIKISEASDSGDEIEGYPVVLRKDLSAYFRHHRLVADVTVTLTVGGTKCVMAEQPLEAPIDFAAVASVMLDLFKPLASGGACPSADAAASAPEKALAPAKPAVVVAVPGPEKVAAPAPATKPAEASEKAILVGFMSYQKSGRPTSVPVRWKRWFSSMELCSATNSGEVQDLKNALAKSGISPRITPDASSATAVSVHWIDESGIEIERRSGCEAS